MRALRWIPISMAALPVVLGVLLNALRPDLMLPLFESVHGRLVVLAVVALAAAGGGIAMLGLWLGHRFIPPERLGLRTSLAVLAAAVPMLLCTLPAIATVLFAPVVHAFMFGDVSSAGPARDDEPRPLLRELD